jgi:hypothetical protein
MFIQNFFLVFGCLFLSAGFVLWTTDDFVESKMIGAKHAKKMILIGVISLTIMALLLKF